MKRSDCPSSTGRVFLTFDDGSASQVDVGSRLLHKYGLPATFFIVAGLTPRSRRYNWHIDRWAEIGWDEIASLHQSGHEIGSHSLTHADLTSLCFIQLRAEVQDARKIIEDNLQADVKSFSYPYGRYNDGVRLIASESYAVCRDDLDDIVPFSLTDLSRVPAWEIPGDVSPERLTAAIGNAAMRALNLVLVFHNLSGDGYATVQEGIFEHALRKIAEYQMMGKIEVCRMSELHALCEGVAK